MWLINAFKNLMRGVFGCLTSNKEQPVAKENVSDIPKKPEQKSFLVKTIKIQSKPSNPAPIPVSKQNVSHLKSWKKPVPSSMYGGSLNFSRQNQGRLNLKLSSKPSKVKASLFNKDAVKGVSIKPNNNKVVAQTVKQVRP